MVDFVDVAIMQQWAKSVCELFNFVVLSAVTPAPHNVPTPLICKTHLPIVLLNVCDLELN